MLFFVCKKGKNEQTQKEEKRKIEIKNRNKKMFEKYFKTKHSDISALKEMIKTKEKIF